MNEASRRRVVAIGELVVDWISTKKGNGFIESETFVKSLGGNASNVAIALARLGTDSRILAKIGNDIHGKYLVHVLEQEGVDTSGVVIDEIAATAQCYVFTTLDDDNTFLNWPPGNAAQLLTAGDITDEHLQDAVCIHTTGISLTKDPRRSAVLLTLEKAKRRGILVSFDAGFPTGEGRGSIQALETAISLADVIKVNLLELFFWARHAGAKISEPDLDFISAYENPPSSGHEAKDSKGSQDSPDLSQNRIRELARGLFDKFQPKILLVTMAQLGSLVMSAEEEVWRNAYKVDSISGVGAGDAFVAGFLHALMENAMPESAASLQLSKESLTRCNDFASAVGAICTTHVSAYKGLPTLANVEELMSKSLRSI